ncbi:hypothetical protein FNV43_RR25350 [Rhamnella rubrinervis]|uniref:Uncharacterized protein n=1 Tax=Rhamnella rubrinervis TaxID=2594499 RepID=A0A8K0GM40_9ROSA|nr:hypothetical protein FNV43_RR25350 [Rhamnella rubrinervis]
MGGKQSWFWELVKVFRNIAIQVMSKLDVLDEIMRMSGEQRAFIRWMPITSGEEEEELVVTAILPRIAKDGYQQPASCGGDIAPNSERWIPTAFALIEWRRRTLPRIAKDGYQQPLNEEEEEEEWIPTAFELIEWRRRILRRRRIAKDGYQQEELVLESSFRVFE